MQNTGTGAPGNGRIPLGGTMTEEHLQFTVGDREVSGLRVLPENQAPACTLVYAPGAGSNLQDPFGKYLAERLGGAGITTVRFQFPYDGGGKTQAGLTWSFRRNLDRSGANYPADQWQIGCRRQVHGRTDRLASGCPRYGCGCLGIICISSASPIQSG